jgi:hypothetical protein
MVDGTMIEHESEIEDLDLALALRRLADGSEPPPIDPRREAALMAAFDSLSAVAAQQRRRAARADAPVRRPFWGMASLAAAAALLIAVLVPIRAGRGGHPSGEMALHKPLLLQSRPVQLEMAPPAEFTLVPGAAALPPMESGSLVRMDVPVAMLPSLGLTPPAGSGTVVKADVIVGQDGLTRAVRLVD